MNEQVIAAHKVLDMIEKAGYEAYLVGGCVRDRLLGKDPADYDVTTNALPAEIQQIFPHTIPTGLQHGTVSVIQDKIVIEVTTFRVEGKYEDFRRPNDVQFVSSLKEDLMRRDFTINAMAMDKLGRIFDYADGQIDLVKKKIRTVGRAEDRFQEDALRMLRACRFAAKLAFEIDPITVKAIVQSRQYANRLAVERIVVEFTKVFSAKQPSIGLIPLVETKLIEYLPPFSKVPITQEITEKEWSKLDRLPTEIARWSYFLFLVFSPTKHNKQVCYTNIISILPKFKFSNQTKKSISNIFKVVDEWSLDITEEEAKLLLLQYQLETVSTGQILWQAITNENKFAPLKQWWEQMSVHQISDLAINGNDLLKVTGIPAGPWLKETLNYLYHQVAYGRIPNELEALKREGEKYGASHPS